jgi:hypothetical protein
MTSDYITLKNTNCIDFNNNPTFDILKHFQCPVHAVVITTI